MNTFTDAEMKQVSCIACGASSGEFCTEKFEGVDVPMLGYHKERVELREKLPVMPPDMPALDATDKAIIVYYAFVALCNSCQTKSLEIFGKTFTSREIQYAFASQGLKAAKEDGLIGGPKPNRKERRVQEKKMKRLIIM